MEPQDRRLLEELASRGRWVDEVAQGMIDAGVFLAIVAGALVLGRAVYREGLRDGVARGMRRSREEHDDGLYAKVAQADSMLSEEPDAAP